MRLHQHPALEEKQRKTKPQQLRIQFFTGPPIHQYRRKQNNPETRKKTRNQTNILIGHYQYFLSQNKRWLQREPLQGYIPKKEKEETETMLEYE